MFQTLEAELRANGLEKAFQLFRSAGIEPILVKGWAIARRYPELGLRPLGDFDLIVEPSKLLSAKDLLQSSDGRSLSIDLHKGFEGLDQLTFEELYSRSKTVSLNDAKIRVLADEDHLRVICVHLLRHGAFRPLWLCDVAVAVENAGAGFDWDRCLTNSRRHSEWVACTIALARDLLGADLRDAAPEVKLKRLPVWLVNNILEKWSMPFASQYGTNRHRAPMRTYLQQPGGVLKDLRNRWPDPIEATISVNGPLNEWPRVPFQVANGVLRTARFLKSL